jgi:CIC family chloride channel protein
MDRPISTSQWRRGGHLFMVLIAGACGLAGAFGAIVFRLLIRLFQGAFFGGMEGVAAVYEKGILAETGDPMAVAQTLSWPVLLVIPALGGLIVGPLVYFFAREARGHGVPEVMEAVAVRGGVMRPRVVAVKTLASAICIGSGGSVGREGPIVQIGSALGSAIGQMLRVPARQLRTIVGCGAAAGIAATFNAPIAGALFAVEVIVGDFAVTQFSPIVISAVVATVVSRYFLGNTPAFPVPEYQLVSPFELGPYIMVGVVAGLIGTVFVRTLYATEDAFGKLTIPEWAKASLGGLLIGAFGIFFPSVFGVGYSTIEMALSGELPVLLLGVLLGVKILATSITIGSGGSGGIFAPSLFLGAMTGGLCGKLLHGWFPTSTAGSGAYALVTMGAVVAATTHAPLSAIIIIFELTQTIDIIPPLMAACVVSSLIAMFLSRDSIYTMKLTRRGVDLHREDDPNVLKSLYVREIIDREPQVVPASASLEQVLSLIVESDHTEFFVINEAEELIGAIYLHELRRIILEQDHLRSLVVAEDLLERNRPSVREKLVGSVHKRDVINAYNQEVMRRDLAGGVSTTIAVVDKVHQVDLGGGYVVQEVLTPRSLVGQSLRELDLRTKAGVQVLIIRSPTAKQGASAIRVPDPNARIDPGDKLVVAGPKDAVDSLANS